MGYSWLTEEQEVPLRFDARAKRWVTLLSVPVSRGRGTSVDCDPGGRKTADRVARRAEDFPLSSSGLGYGPWVRRERGDTPDRGGRAGEETRRSEYVQ